jgi:hypothetical protein
MGARRAESGRRARRALAWSLALFAVGQAAVGWYVSRVRPEVRDPEYGAIITGLRTRLAAEPGRRLVLVLGSSRSAGLLRPTALEPPPPGETAPLLYNCSMVASGPIRELQALRRLLHDGVRPDWLLIEVWTPYLVQRAWWYEDAFISSRDLRPADWPVLRYVPAQRAVARRNLLEGLLVPAATYRQQLMAALAPDLLPPPEIQASAWEDPNRRHREDGWLDPPGPSRKWEPAFELVWWQTALRTYWDPFVARPQADAALREMLSLAAGRGIRVCLLLCPDHSRLRGPAGMASWEANRAYLDQVSRDFGVPVIDTRDWVADKQFTDCVHACRAAAGPYTRRLAHEVLYPLVEGRPVTTAIQLAPASSSVAAAGPAH